jgi:hypothetical protein
VISAIVHDDKTEIGLLILGDEGKITILHCHGDDEEVLEYARGGDYLPLAFRLRFGDATPEMLTLGAERLADNLGRERHRPKTANTRRERFLIAASVALLVRAGRSRKDALFLTGQAFKCKPRKIDAAIAAIGSVKVTVLPDSDPQITADLAAKDTLK